MLQQLFGVGAVAGGAAGIGTQTNSDTMTRADEDPLSGGGNWVCTTNRLRIVSNTVQPNSTSNDRTGIYTVWANGNDHYSQLKITSVGGTAGNGLGVCVRHDPTVATVTMYRLVINGDGEYDLAKIVAGVYTSLASGTTTYSAAAPLGLSVSGTTLKIWYNGAQVGTNVTDAIIATGVPGITYSSSLASVPSGTDWTGGTVP